MELSDKMAIAEVKFIVSEKKLFAALRALENVALQPPVVHIPNGIDMPVTAKKNGHAGPTAVTVLLDFIAKKSLGDKVASSEMRKYMEDNGIHATGVYYGIKRCAELGKISRIGDSFDYRVTKGK